jgi:hypothetical protein
MRLNLAYELVACAVIAVGTNGPFGTLGKMTTRRT